jgi:nucleoside-diphosphate-sugar epimerase
VIGIDSLVADGGQHPVLNPGEVEGFELAVCDIREAEIVDHLAGASHLLHLAGIPGTRGRGQVYEDVNVGGTEAVLAAALEAGVEHVVVASSSSVYGSSPGPQSEDGPIGPRSDYARSKAAAELAALSFGDTHDIEVIALRYFTVYGPGQRPDMLFSRAIESCLGGPSIPLYAGGRNIRSFTHVSDAVAGTLLALRHGQAGNTYNIGGPNPVSVADALELVGEIAGTPVATREEDGDFEEEAILIPDLTRSREVLEYDPAVGLVEGLRSQISARRNAEPKADPRR